MPLLSRRSYSSVSIAAGKWPAVGHCAKSVSKITPYPIRRIPIFLAFLIAANIIGIPAIRARHFHSNKTVQAGASYFTRQKPDTGQESNRVQAERLMAEASKIGVEGTPESRQAALAKLQRALELWEIEGDKREQGKVLNSISEVYLVNNETDKALQSVERARTLFREIGEGGGEADSSNILGEIRMDNGDTSAALEAFQQASQLYEKWPDQKNQSSVLNNLGMTYDELGDPRTAMEYLNRSLVLRQSLGDVQGQASTLANIGSVHDDLGELRAALDYYLQSLPLFRSLKNLRREALVVNNIGYAYSRLGDLQPALEYYTMALPLRRAAGDRRGEAISLSNVGTVYFELGVEDRSMEYFNQSLALFRVLQDRAGEARTLSNIANFYLRAGEPQKALEYFNQVIEVDRVRKDKRSEGQNLREMGAVYYKIKDYARASDLIGQGIAIARAVESRSDEAGGLTKLGGVYAATGRLDEAAAAYAKALEIYRQSGSKERESITLNGSARTEMLRGNLDVALKQISSSIEMAESLRGKFASTDLRMAVLADRQSRYSTYVDVLMRMHDRDHDADFDARAFQVHELARARGLVDLLNEARADIHQGGDPELLKQQTAVQQQIDEKERYRMGLLRQKDKAKQLATVEAELNDLIRTLDQLDAQLRVKSPRYAALTQPGPTGISDLQKGMLDPDTVLLEYGLGDDRSYLWCVTSSGHATFVLPPAAEIESAARRFYGLVSANTLTSASRSSVANRIPHSQTDRDLEESARSLGQMLLGPVADRIKGKRLLIVGEGALEYIPFAALAEPLETGIARTENGDISPYQPLMIGHEIVSIPSASAISFFQDEARRTPASRALAVLADPVFRVDDPRVESAKKSLPIHSGIEKSNSIAVIQRSSRESGLDDFRRLRFSREEARDISAFVPKNSGFVALDFGASRATATSAELGRYRIVHFATHGLLNSRHPELSGLVFSLVNEEGKPQDGFLRFYEIYNLRLNAELVVLSGCQTALGKEVRGEGMLGVTRGFMYAGARRVVSSLWNVDDRATAELMKRFYREMLVEKKSPAAALRSAQISMNSEKGWSSPYYWAAFGLQGDWR